MKYSQSAYEKIRLETKQKNESTYIFLSFEILKNRE